MKNIRFVWDENKNITNQKKHHISFDEAKTIFYDDNARMGISNNLRLLVVVHAYKEQDEIIRIISARKATKNESKYYIKG